ncbi:unnamed protein product, partial [Ixodes pacificus]
AAIAVRPPPYWDRNPRVWFVQAESQFHLAGIQAQGLKYHHVVSALSPTAADAVYDVLSSPSTTAPYDQLKSVLLQRIEASERSRCQQLLSAAELGERRTSQLLRRMIQLLGEGANDMEAALLRELFLQRLPTNVQMVLAAAAPLDLAGLAGLADAVMEVSAPSVIIAADITTQSAGDASNTAQDIRTPQKSEGYVNEFCQRLEQAVLSTTRRQDPDRSPHRRGRSTSRREDNERSNRDSSPRLCYYHRRFGPGARRCERPCAWPE